MTAKARPMFECSIAELIEYAEDDGRVEDVKRELAFRKSRKAKKLAKELGCVTKRRPSTAEQLSQWDGVEPLPVEDPHAGFGDGPQENSIL